MRFNNSAVRISKVTATRRLLLKKLFLKILQKFTGKHLSWSLFFKNFEILETPILKNICERLLLWFVGTLVDSGDILSVFTKRRKLVQYLSENNKECSL